MSPIKIAGFYTFWQDNVWIWFSSVANRALALRWHKYYDILVQHQYLSMLMHTKFNECLHWHKKAGLHRYKFPQKFTASYFSLQICGTENCREIAPEKRQRRIMIRGNIYDSRTPQYNISLFICCRIILYLALKMV